MMNVEKKAKIAGTFIDCLLGILPLFAGGILYVILSYFISFSSTDYTVVVATMTALVGYSFTAAFFLMALPRTGYLKKLDKKNLTNKYALIIASPAVTGILNLTSDMILQQQNCIFVMQIKFLSNVLFFSTIIYFFFTLYIIFRILHLYRNSLED